MKNRIAFFLFIFDIVIVSVVVVYLIVVVIAYGSPTIQAFWEWVNSLSIEALWILVGICVAGILTLVSWNDDL